MHKLSYAKDFAIRPQPSQDVLKRFAEYLKWRESMGMPGGEFDAWLKTNQSINEYWRAAAEGT